MEPKTETLAGSIPTRTEPDDTGLESLQFQQEIQRLMTPPPPENASSFTALLELPATQAMELLHSTHSETGAPAPATGDAIHPTNDDHKPYFPSFNNAANLTFPLNQALIERAAIFSVFATAGENSQSPATSSVPSNSSANLDKVKSEPPETDSNPNSSQPLVSDPSVENKTQRSAKRKEREKKGKGSSKKNKNESSEDAEKLPYVHVRARRGQATDSHSLAERARREKINARMKLLQELVPGCSKISGTALVLDEIINHVQSLQRQVELLSMRLAAVNPRIDFNLDNLFATENPTQDLKGPFPPLICGRQWVRFGPPVPSPPSVHIDISGSLMDSNFPSMVSPLMWPEIPFNGNRPHYQQQQQWHFDALHQPLWGREEDNHNFITSENSLLSYDSSANSASLPSNQLKMEL